MEEQQSSGDVFAAGEVIDTAKRNDVKRATRERQKQELDLQRERVLSERTSSPHRRSALELYPESLGDLLPT